MKRIRVLDEPTPLLTDYLDSEGKKANWIGFHSHQSGKAYQELVTTLQKIQHGLCGYCEIDINERDKQIEHVVPQSDSQHGAKRTLDHTNMIVSCKGGTLESMDEARRLNPVKRNLSCGQAKGNLVDPDFLDPRTLPALPSLVRVRFGGEIAADIKACTRAGIDVIKVTKTINILGLNVKRLRLAREKRWNALNDCWRRYHDDPHVMREAALTELSPIDDNTLSRFFTTSRSYFTPLSEEILAKEPKVWI